MRADSVKVVEGWGAEDVENDRKLVVVVAAREEGLAGEHLCEYTTNGPHINCTGIFLEGEHDLGSAVPAGGDVFWRYWVRIRRRAFEGNRTCHKGLGIVCGTWRRLGGPGETEIAELNRDGGESKWVVPDGWSKREKTDLEIAVGV